MLSISTAPLAGILLILALTLTARAAAHEEDRHAQPGAEPPLILGVLEFPTSGDPAAQEAFERGVMLLHSFEYDDARTAFLEAQAIDPGFAMAIWGEAMTLNHPLWNQQKHDEALQVLEKLPAPALRRTTPLEERFIEAVTILYAEGSKEVRDTAYREALAGMHEDFPGNFEVAAFYALSILGSVYERDFRTYMQAAAIAEEVFAAQPRHPGAAHYLIHSYDDQIHAPLGLRAARVYATIAPAAAHAQHMVSHIFTSLGMWNEVIKANAASVQVSEEAMLRAGRSKHMRSKHALHWLEYALLQEGRTPEAADALHIMQEDVEALPDAQNTRHSAMMRATFVVEQPLLDAQLAPIGEGDLPLYHRCLEDFSTAWQRISHGDLDSARLAHERITQRLATAKVLSVEEGLHEQDGATSADDFLLMRVIALEMEALLYFHRGDQDRALDLIAQAVAEETSRPLYYGPPHVPKPADELMGEMLLALDRPAEALTMFEQSLARHTARTLSLLGLARAQSATGDAAASETWQKLEAQWRGDADTLRTLPYPWLPAAASTTPATTGIRMPGDRAAEGTISNETNRES